ncbi:hypothetical protein B0H67DRAFT_640327 [Lasiosphaeris hirsuta]|uniref:Cytochrome P450 n=1 Tax=Lasiosphaeris hirsuta TaxID=260670 RepID=A0AA40BD06_9PEZI|nr:hypothetical protein B0H67DRAFT_640327 [Lasiosphaeris hirsuta]
MAVLLSYLPYVVEVAIIIRLLFAGRRPKTTRQARPRFLLLATSIRLTNYVQMLYEMATQPEGFLHHIRRYSYALTTTMVYGWRTPTYKDKKMQQLFNSFSDFADINQTGTAALIDCFPWMRWLPEFLIPTQQKARDMHKLDTAAGTITRCFCEELVASQRAESFSDDQAAYISSTLLEAGSDTVSSTPYAFAQAIVLYTDAQRSARPKRRSTA